MHRLVTAIVKTLPDIATRPCSCVTGSTSVSALLCHAIHNALSGVHNQCSLQPYYTHCHSHVNRQASPHCPTPGVNRHPYSLSPSMATPGEQMKQ